MKQNLESKNKSIIKQFYTPLRELKTLTIKFTRNKDTNSLYNFTDKSHKLIFKILAERT